MTPLRTKMIEDLRLRGLATTTEETYVAVVAQFARMYGRSPADLDYGHVRGFLLDVRARGRKPATLAQYWSALRFLFVETLGRKDFAEHVPRPRQLRLQGRVGPTLEEIRLILAHARTAYDRASSRPATALDCGSPRRWPFRCRTSTRRTSSSMCGAGRGGARGPFISPLSFSRRFAPTGAR